MVLPTAGWKACTSVRCSAVLKAECLAEQSAGHWGDSKASWKVDWMVASWVVQSVLKAAEQSAVKRVASKASWSVE